MPLHPAFRAMQGPRVSQVENPPNWNANGTALTKLATIRTTPLPPHRIPFEPRCYRHTSAVHGVPQPGLWNLPFGPGACFGSTAVLTRAPWRPNGNPRLSHSVSRASRANRVDELALDSVLEDLECRCPRDPLGAELTRQLVRLLETAHDHRITPMADVTVCCESIESGRYIVLYKHNAV
ncbi:hypothetical protein N658DRAFT_93630 [Parathielavia hyrcaniae]|uniref:Uncharacterized protein n=1 Tax=Parathielavia hyrcaniae TaxID=113614 RepID=A0AAN6PZH9_9PEZI|nr:hypothetical protein N658DRAFT_93630 [Parathielavia hyrcaniae]